MSIAKVGYVRAKDYPEHKKRRIEELVGYFKKYRYALLVSITGITAQVMHETRRMLRERGEVLKVIKNTLTKLAIDRVSSERPGLEGLKRYLEGQNALIFTNRNPFSVRLFLDRNKIPREARAGDVLTRDVVVPSGNTGFPPGPLISLFNKLKIPTTIREGSIWVTKDTLVAKKGDVVSPELADLLKRLGIKPVEVGLEVKAIYMDGRVLGPEESAIDLESYRRDLEEAHRAAVNLAVNACVPTAETAPLMIAKAHVEALALAVEAALPTPDALKLALARAHTVASALLSRVEGRGG